MSKQVFQTESKSRWKKVKWSIRFIGFIALVFVAIFVTMMILDQLPFMPFKQDYRSVVSASAPYYKSNKWAKEYKGIRRLIHERKAHHNYSQVAGEKLKRIRRFQGKGDALTQKYIDSWDDKSAGIRAAFYVNWDPQSFVSLKQHIGQMNLVVPEWFFIDPKDGNLITRIDQRAFSLMKKTGIPIMPLLTNSMNDVFQPEAIGEALKDAKRADRLINSLLDACLKNNFVGINIDLENLNPSTQPYLLRFMQRLAKRFREKDLYVTQDVPPFDDDFNLKELSKCNDYLFLMAYDEHTADGVPGPVGSRSWIEKALQQSLKAVPEEKLILGLAAYGYDWDPSGKNSQGITYHDALAEASDTKSQIDFDGDTYNLHFAYDNGRGQIHQVYFTDAATQFNLMRLGIENDLAGFGLWRLGSEDSRLWSFYTQDLEQEKAEKYPIKQLEYLKGSKDAHYLGEGEVLDVIKTPHPGYAQMEMDKEDATIASEDYKEIPTSYQLQKYGYAAPNELLLTFDDGPDSRWTPKVLDILNKYHVKAAFFMVGIQMEKNLPIVKRVFEDGNFIGNHTFTHHNIAENSKNRTFVELQLTRLLIESVTGRSTILFRAPYNADSDPAGHEELIPIVLARKQNYLDVGESIDPEDWEPGVTADQIFNRVVSQVERGCGNIILLHDAGGDTRKATIEALPRIIEYFQKRGYHFITLDKYLDKTKAQLMPPIAKGKSYYAMQANLALATVIYDIGKFIAAMFILFVALGILRILFMLFLTFKERKKAKKLLLNPVLLTKENAPKVSIIVPAYNEGVNIVSSIRNLLQQHYPNFDIIFVNDGSRDDTLQKVTNAYKEVPQVTILSKENGGKAAALNYGIQRTDAEYVVCIDADTKLRKDAVSFLMQHFLQDKEGKIGAVAGNVKVGNKRNILTHWQSVEYTTSQNFDRQAYAAINAVTVVPGAIGAFRKSAIEKSGGLTTDTLAEDCDLTIRIIRAGYIVANENRAIAFTEAPEKLGAFIKQRTRWTFGVMQTFWKHRNALLTRHPKGLGWWAFPNMLIFQFIIPTFSPIADVLMLAALFTDSAMQVLFYYLIFTVIDAGLSIMAYCFEREDMKELFWILPQRLAYRWIMYFVLFKSYKKAIKGELQTWGVLKRTGNVKEIE